MAQEEVHRFRTLLARLVAEQRITCREVDKRLRWSAGLTAKILRGDRHDLRLSHLLSILNVIEVEPSTFFKAAYSDEARAPRLLSYLGEEPPPLPSLSILTSLTLDDFIARVKDALREVLDEREQGGSLSQTGRRCSGRERRNKSGADENLASPVDILSSSQDDAAYATARIAALQHERACQDYRIEDPGFSKGAEVDPGLPGKPARNQA